MSWSLERAREVYGLRHWGEGYFDIQAPGHVVVHADRSPAGPGIDLLELSDRLCKAGVDLPVLVHFSDILRDRVQRQCRAFQEAAGRLGYRGGFSALYPVKVNQQRSVVEAILSGGGDCAGLEAGSKPELMAVLALSRPGGTIVCNGYKDAEYIRLALVGQELGYRVYLVVEKPAELKRIMALSARMGLRPRLGVRLRLSTLGTGNWQNTGGEKSKFGLTAGELLTAVETLRRRGLLDALELMHFHMGSQIGNIHDIQRGLREAGRYYAELRAQGAPIERVDVGGGLGVDYEGTRSRSACSVNYSLEEYAHHVVQTFAQVCEREGLPEPHLLTESGRALSAHHAVLITDVVDVEPVLAVPPEPPAATAPQALGELWALWRGLAQRPLVEGYHDAVQLVGEAREQFIHGLLGLADLGRAEALYRAVAMAMRPRLDPASLAHREILDELNQRLVDRYFCNFSVFQSLPDVWALQQVFPILPLHRLDEEPGRNAVLRDLSCDSDGRIDCYAGEQGVTTHLRLHALREGEPYRLGFFLVGAYQEILGDMHNLFGRVSTVDVHLGEDGIHLGEPERGDRTRDVLEQVHYASEDLWRAYQAALDRSGLSPEKRQQYAALLRQGQAGYTYLKET